MRDALPARTMRTLRREAERGFTLIELGVVVVIIGLLVGLGIPMYTGATLSSRLSSYANNLVSSIHLARSEAMKRNETVRLCASANGTSCATSGGWQQGWIVLHVASSTVLHRQQPFATSFVASLVNASSTAVHDLDFAPTGINLYSTSYQLTVSRGDTGVRANKRWVCLSATGKPSFRDPRVVDTDCFGNAI